MGVDNANRRAGEAAVPRRPRRKWSQEEWAEKTAKQNLVFRAAMARKPAAMAVCKKLEHQFPKTPEGRLWFAVLRKAIEDLFVRRERAAASRFLRGGMPIIEMAGVDPDWVRSQLARAEVSLDPIFD